MKKTQKLKVTIAGMGFETTYGKIPEKIKHMADALVYEEFGFYVNGVVMDGYDEIFVTVDYLVGPDEKRPRAKIKPTIFGYDADEFMAKQYK